MKKIYIRNFLIILFGFIVLTVIYIITMNYIDRKEYSSRHATMMKGAITELQIILSQHSQDQWNALLTKLSKPDAYSAEIIPLKKLSLDPTSMQRLLDSNIINSSKIHHNIWSSFKPDTFLYKRICKSKFVIKLQDSRVSTNLLLKENGWMRGLVIRKLSLTPRKQWNDVISQAIKWYHTPIKLLNKNSILIPPDIKLMLQGSSVSYQKLISTNKNNQIVFYFKKRQTLSIF